MRRWTALLLCAGVVGLASACSSDDDDGGADAGPGDAGTTDGGDGGTPLAAIGAACTADADCAGPDAKCLTNLPGGYCVRTGCSTDADCGGGAKCEDVGSEKLCVDACAAANECRAGAGYECDDGACWPAGFVVVNPGAAKTGAPCDDGADCESDSCIPETDSEGATGYAGGYCSNPCADDGDCAGDAKCHRTACRKKCAGDGECRAGYKCIQSMCLRDPAGAHLGAACTEATEAAACGWGDCLTDASVAGFPGGYCTALGDCALDGSGCGPDGECFATGTDPSDARYCLDRCANDGECRAGYACEPAFKVCLLAPAPDPADVKLGEACATDADCDEQAGAKGVCFRTESFPGGYCVAPGCTPQDGATPDSCAAADGACFSVGDSPVLFCLKACTASAQCRVGEGYECTADEICDQR